MADLAFKIEISPFSTIIVKTPFLDLTNLLTLLKLFDIQVLVGTYLVDIIPITLWFMRFLDAYSKTSLDG